MAINKTTAKISQTEISGNQVQGQTNPLKGNVSENQAVFDRLPKKIAAKFNNFVDTVAGEFENVGAPIDEHTNNKANPHQVTASQVGSYSKEETDTKLAVVEAVAKGRAKGYVFDTKADLDAWLLNEENTAKLVMGDNFYIRDTSVPDYWWDADNKKISELETQKVDLAEYAKTENVDSKVQIVETELVQHKQSKNNPHKVTAEQVGAYTKDETDAELDKKANKADVVSAYRFYGSVETFADLPKKYSFIPNGAPYIIADGVKQEVGTYDKETHTVTIAEDIWDFEVVFPIVPITVPKGTYYCDKVELCYYAMIGDNWFNTKLCLPNDGCDYAYTDTEKVIDKVSSYGSDGCYAGNSDNLGTLYKALPTWTFEQTEDDGMGGTVTVDVAYIPEGAYDNGAVYEVKDSGLNYGWNGSTWDALGTSHIDQEARSEIEGLKEGKANKSDVYTRTDVNSLLSQKANKSDIVKAYRFCGSVNTFDDLPNTYSIIANGAPYVIVNGIKHEVGTYDEETHTIKFDYYDCSEMEEEWRTIFIPIVPITVPKGSYYCNKIESYDYVTIGDNWFNTIQCMSSTYCQFAYTDSEKVIDKISHPPSEYHGGNYLGTLYKVLPTWTFEQTEDDGMGGTVTVDVAYIPEGAYDNGAVYEVKDSGLNYGWNGSTWDALGTSHIDQEARSEIEGLKEGKANKSDVYTKAETYTKTEVSNRLISYVQKSDIVNAYRFCGSVDTFDDLPVGYPLIPGGVPTFNGVACGTYNEYEDYGNINSYDGFIHVLEFNTVTFTSHQDKIIVPIVPITLKPGDYYWRGDGYRCREGAYVYASIFDGMYSNYNMWGNNYFTLTESLTIDHIELFNPFPTDYPQCTVTGNYNYIENFGTLPRIISSWGDSEKTMAFIPQGAYDNGAVYNVLDTGMNYAWNGKEYDALGGEHKDLEARADIYNLETQMGDVETALDNIIAIQNELIGGEDV